jgi:hypothetical protein
MDSYLFSCQDKTWSEFSTLEDPVCATYICLVIPTFTTILKVENSAQTTFRLSPIRYCTPLAK